MKESWMRHKQESNKETKRVEAVKLINVIDKENCDRRLLIEMLEERLAEHKAELKKLKELIKFRRKAIKDLEGFWLKEK